MRQPEVTGVTGTGDGSRGTAGRPAHSRLKNRSLGAAGLVEPRVNHEPDPLRAELAMASNHVSRFTLRVVVEASVAVLLASDEDDTLTLLASTYVPRRRSQPSRTRILLPRSRRASHTTDRPLLAVRRRPSWGHHRPTQSACLSRARS